MSFYLEGDILEDADAMLNEINGLEDEYTAAFGPAGWTEAMIADYEATLSDNPF